MLDDKGRILTLIVEIPAKTTAPWIWEGHMQGGVHGILIHTISDGNMFKERDRAIGLLKGLRNCSARTACDLLEETTDFLQEIGEL